MITITRDQARALRAVLRRGFGRAPQGIFSGALLSAAPTGVTARAWNDTLAVEFGLDVASGNGDALVPLDVLDRCQARSHEPVTLDWSEHRGLSVQWHDKGSAQLAARPTGKLPTPPAFFGADVEVTRCAKNLWSALGEAATIATDNSSRYALNTIQLRGGVGEVIATDARQVLLQGGFEFPWTGDVLLPVTWLFTGREMAPADEVMVGALSDWISFGTGPWTVWLRKISDRRYPDVRSAIPAIETCPSRLNISDADAEFLIDTLPALPSDDLQHHAVTLDLNGRVLLRAKPPADGPVTQVCLPNSRLTGQPLTLNTNRDYLLSALRLGFRELAFQSPHTPVVCDDGQRQYVWALLSPEGAVGATDSMQELVAPDVMPADVPDATKNPPERKTKMKNRKSLTNGATPAASPSPGAPPQPAETPACEMRDAGSPSATPADGPIPSTAQTSAASQPNRSLKKSAALDHALHVRSLLRETLVQMDGLVSTLRQQRKQSQLVRTTLNSLRQLERAAG